MKSEQVIQRYLARHAEPSAHAYVEQIANGTFDSSPSPVKWRRALVVPAYDEPAEFMHRFLAHPEIADTIIILVINAPLGAPPDALKRTQELLDNARYVTRQNLIGQNLHIVDLLDEPIPKHRGVGLARKLGTDIALHLQQRNLISSPWLFQTDADATLPENYFSETQFPDRGAVTFSHRHIVTGTPPDKATPHALEPTPEQLQLAATLYEQHMAYYINGLASAGSIYAYPTLGSTLVVHASDYAAVRGYPRRNAGEDFYLLNKIAKVSDVAWLADVTIDLEARTSERVPFGTGPALRKIITTLLDQADGSGYLSYHPQCFALLKLALQDLRQFGTTGHWTTANSLPTQGDHIDSPNAHSQNTLAERVLAQDLLNQLGWHKVRTGFSQQFRTTKQRCKAANDWFDAFRTMRFIHLARSSYPDQPLLETLGRLGKKAIT